MGRGKPFLCEITVSPGVEEKLAIKHQIDIWEIEEAVYDDPHAFSLKHRDCHFIYGQTSAGRYLFVLLRILNGDEVRLLRLPSGTNVAKIITARDMNQNQRQLYRARKGKS